MIYATSSFFVRVSIFLRERIPPLPLIIQSLFLSIGIGLSYSLLESVPLVEMKVPLIGIFLGSFALSVVVRVIDEFKDKDDDKRLFPERCLPSGRVLYSDIKVLGWFFLSFFIILNIILGQAYLQLFFLLFYFFLFSKWCFLPEKWRGDLIIILITHNPIGLFVGLYFLSFLSSAFGGKNLTFNHYLLSIGFWLPTFAWEVARKIKAPEEENNYKTYSQRFGIKRALLFPIFALGIQCFVFYLLFADFFKETYWAFNMFFSYLMYVAFCLLFAFRPSPKLSKMLRPMTELYLFILNVILIIFGLKVAFLF
ncbi:MAG: UbiA family prenyltransferase [Bdellovibrionota bacterium]|nr:UbiA family prenyltransferase [Bdellovibrionota bacterium]